MNKSIKCRVGCDIGGTFTDIVLLNEGTGQLRIVKVPSTTVNPEKGVKAGLKKIFDTSEMKPGDVSYFFHATTIATNAIIGQVGLKLPKTAFITTKGFRDILEIGRQTRPRLYDFFMDKPKPLVPRYLRKEVTERIRYDGSVLKPLNESEVKKIAKELIEEKIESVAVCTLFSFLNSKHEKRIGEILKSEIPEVHISLSHEVLPEYREYPRAATTLINAMLFPIVKKYLEALEEELVKMGLKKSRLYVMSSSGGTMSFSRAKNRPVHMIESGPAAGVVAAAFMGEIMGRENLVSFDMGGTTAKVGLVREGKPIITTDYEVGGTTHGGRAVRGSGYPIKVPVIDLIEVGSGGGSMAWIDKGGIIKVGPQSAGANPGPVCYGLGNTEPTITDAYVSLGVINPEYFLGGEMKIDAEAARESIRGKIAEPLGMDEIEAANGIAKIANSNMVKAVKILTVERGLDPRELVFMAFGGAGPMVAGKIASELGFPSIIIPETPGLFSAYGLLVTDIKLDYSFTYLCKVREIKLNELNRKIVQMERRGTTDLMSEGVPADKMLLQRSVDMRYVGQSYEINISLPQGEVTVELLEEMERRFHSTHERIYGHCCITEPIEIVNLRLSAIGILPRIKIKAERKGKEKPSREALKQRRKVYFGEKKDFFLCPVYDRYKLSPGNIVYGPAVIEQRDTTTVVYPGQIAKVDAYRNIVIERG